MVKKRSGKVEKSPFREFGRGVYSNIEPLEDNAISIGGEIRVYISEESIAKEEQPDKLFLK
jgi:hypothetical protein